MTYEDYLEHGRRLAGQREDLIAAGVEPAEPPTLADPKPRETRALLEAGKVNFTDPPPNLSTVHILGRDVRIQYCPELRSLGQAGTHAYDYTWMPLTIRLREWNERVFLHEVLHLLVDYPHLFEMISTPDDKRPIHERTVQVIEDGLWDLGWRWHGGDGDE